jgi:hypothetical protein
MAVTSQELHRSAKQRTTGQHRTITGQFSVVNNPSHRATGPLQPAYIPAQPQRRAARLPYVITTLLVLTAFALIASSLLTWSRIKLDDLRYGRPRTTSLNGFVNHNETGGVPSQFVAMNVNRRVVVFEIPGGDPAQIRTLTGPYLFGANEDLTPVRLRLALVNDDKESDLVVSVKNEEIVYINENGNFRLITPDERTAHQHKLVAAEGDAGLGTDQ